MVKIDHELSSIFNIHAGVRQGSILSPYLCIVYSTKDNTVLCTALLTTLQC